MRKLEFVWMIIGLWLITSACVHAFEEISYSGLYRSSDSLPPLQFDEHHTFRILQLTDLHYDQTIYGATIRQQMETLVRLSDPDLLILTGDIVWGQPVPALWWDFIFFLAHLEKPYLIVLGNHDSEHKLSRKQLYQLISTFPNCRNRFYQDPTAFTEGDMVVEVKGSHHFPGAILFLLDSNEITSTRSLLGLQPQQTQWYLNRAKFYQSTYPTDSIPALAFMHIPQPEMESIYQDRANYRIGNHRQKGYEGNQSGFLETLLKTHLVNGVFNGHDHFNDYLIHYQGVALAYGRSSGADNVYGDLPAGARIIELSEGRVSFRTYILQCDGKIEFQLTFPDDVKK